VSVGSGAGSPAYDVVVLGQGVVGASAALRAATTGARVAVVDPGSAGQATAAGAGIVSPVGLGGEEVSSAWTSLVASAIAHYQGLVGLLADTTGAGAGFAKVGEIVAATREEDLPALQLLAERLPVLAAEGIQVGTVERLSGSDLTTSWPELRPDLDGLFIENVARVDGRRLRTALVDAARRRGATFLEGHARLRVGEDRPVSLLVDDRPLAAGSVVVAAGAWAQPMLEQLGIGLRVQPDRGQIVHLEVDSPGTESRPVVNTFEGHYLLGFPGHRIVTGATHEPEAGFDHRVTAGGLGAVLGRTLRIAPGLSKGTLVETRVGFRPQSSDGYPIVGRTRAADDVVVATGLGAWGLTLGPLLGEVAADQALGLAPSFDAGFLGPDRRPIDSTTADLEPAHR
jgi:D-amino-acid dehydrogenase